MKKTWVGGKVRGAVALPSLHVPAVLQFMMEGAIILQPYPSSIATGYLIAAACGWPCYFPLKYPQKSNLSPAVVKISSAKNKACMYDIRDGENKEGSYENRKAVNLKQMAKW